MIDQTKFRIQETWGNSTIVWTITTGDWPAPEFKVYETDDSGSYQEDDLGLEGFIKWDNCGHFLFDEKGYFHICGKHHMEDIFNLIRHLFKRSAELWGVKHIDYINEH